MTRRLLKIASYLSPLVGVYLLLYVLWTAFLRDVAPPATPYGDIAFSPARWAHDRLRLILNGGNGEGLSAISVKVIRASAEDLKPGIAAPGEIQFFEKVDIVSKTGGRIERVLVNEGQVVKKGQLLVQIERLPLELQLRQQDMAVNSAQAQLALTQERYNNARLTAESRFRQIERQETQVKQLRAELERMRSSYQGQETLLNEGAISREQFEQARVDLINREAAYLMARKDLDITLVGYRDRDITDKGLRVPEDAEARARLLIDLNTRIEKAEVDVARAQLESAKAAMASTRILLNETAIRAPMDAFVAARNKSAGEEVTGGGTTDPSQAILVLVDIRKVYVAIPVQESEAKRVERGMSLEFTVDVFPGERYNAEVELISPLIDPRTHTVSVKGILNNPGMRLRPGMFIRGRVITGAPKATILVPHTALQPRDEKSAYAFVIRQGKVFRVEVETGQQIDDRIEITKGIASGDLVAIEKFSLLRDGLSVRPEITGQS